MSTPSEDTLAQKLANLTPPPVTNTAYWQRLSAHHQAMLKAGLAKKPEYKLATRPTPPRNYNTDPHL